MITDRWWRFALLPIFLLASTMLVACRPPGEVVVIEPAQACLDVSDPRTVAVEFYDRVEAGDGIAECAAAIFTAFNVPIEQDYEAGYALIQEGQPVVFDFQLELVERGYVNDMAVGLGSFIGDLSDHGFEAADPSGPLTLEYLSGHMAYLLEQDSYSQRERVPALVLAMRNDWVIRTDGKLADPVWGNDLLDPMPYLLLSYAITYAPVGQDVSAAFAPVEGASVSKLARPAAQSGAGIAQFTKGFIKYGGPPVELYRNQTHYVWCKQAWLEGAKLTLKADPIALYHWQQDESNPPDYKSILTAKLDFTWRPSPAIRDFLDLIDCGVPEKIGGVPSKTVNWYPSETAQAHGNLIPELVETETSGDKGRAGEASATYQTIVETVPRPLRIKANRQGPEPAIIEVRVQGLVPDHEKLESVRRLSLLGTIEGVDTQKLALGIFYYEAPALAFEWSFTEQGLTHLIEAYTCDGTFWEGSFTVKGNPNGLPVVAEGGFAFSVEGNSSGPVETPGTIDYGEAQGLISILWELTLTVDKENNLVAIEVVATGGGEVTITLSGTTVTLQSPLPKGGEGTAKLQPMGECPPPGA